MTTFSVTKALAPLELCLHFANTLAWHKSEQPEEKLNSYGDLLVWAAEAGLLATEQRQQLRELAQQAAEQAAAALQEAITLRELMYSIIVAVINGRSPAPTALATFNDALSQAAIQRQLTHNNAGFLWTWPAPKNSFTHFLWPILQSCADLLTTPELLSRVGQCADDRGCGFLFLDLSKNHSRRWCDSNDCGNRAKQRRYYRRQQQANQG